MSGYFTVILGLGLAASLSLNGHLVKTNGAIEERIRGHEAVIAELRKQPEWIDKITVRYAGDQEAINKFRSAVRSEFRAALKDPSFKAWAPVMLPLPAAAGGGLLGAVRPGSGADVSAANAQSGATSTHLEREHQR